MSEEAGRAAGLLAHVSPMEAGYAKRPTPVSRWSDEPLRAWLGSTRISSTTGGGGVTVLRIRRRKDPERPKPLRHAWVVMWNAVLVLIA